MSYLFRNKWLLIYKNSVFLEILPIPLFCKAARDPLLHVLGEPCNKFFNSIVKDFQHYLPVHLVFHFEEYSFQLGGEIRNEGQNCESAIYWLTHLLLGVLKRVRNKKTSKTLCEWVVVRRSPCTQSVII